MAVLLVVALIGLLLGIVFGFDAARSSAAVSQQTGSLLKTSINERWFRGAVVVLTERNRDAASRLFIGDTYLNGLTSEERTEAIRWIGLSLNARPP